MGEMGASFEHGSSFELGEVSGSLRLEKFEVQYSELFADAIEDGVITPEERQKLDRAADALGLDRMRLRNLEEAMQAIYEVRNRTKIVDLSATEGPASLQPLEPATDARAIALQRRIQMLEARVAELEKELTEARAHINVEVDLSGVTKSRDSRAPQEDTLTTLRNRIAHDPRDAELHRALYRHFFERGNVDGRYNAAHALSFLKAADAEQTAFLVQNRADGLIRPARSLSAEGWRRYLFHPDEELLTGEIFAVIASPVLLGRMAALRRDKLLPSLDPATRQDPSVSTLQAVRCVAWAASILGMPAPPIHADGAFEGVLTMVPSIPPAARLGRGALQGRSPAFLAFLAGSYLAMQRAEHIVKQLVPAIADLEDLFLAALVIGNPGIPLRADTRRRVMPLASAIEPILEPGAVDRLRGAFLRFVEEGGRTNLQRWALASSKTAARAGLLICNDLSAASAALEATDATLASELIDDLLVFVTTDRYTNLRKQIGIALGVT